MQCYYAMRVLCECACGGENHQLGHQNADGGERVAVANGHEVVACVVAGDSRPAVGAPPAPPAGAVPAVASPPALRGSDFEKSGVWITASEPGMASSSDSSARPLRQTTRLTEAESARLIVVQAAQAQNPAAHELANAEIADREPLSVSANYVERVTLADGSTAYLKPVGEANSRVGQMYRVAENEQAIHEAAAFHLADAMGERYSQMMPTAAVVEDEQHGLAALISHRDGVDGFSTAWQLQASPDDVHDAAFFDAVCGNADRHSGNFLVSEGDDGEDHLSLIDHGFSFHRPGGAINAPALIITRAQAGDQALDAQETQLLHRLNDSPDLLGAEPMIGTERAAAMRARITQMLNTGQIAVPDFRNWSWGDGG